MTDKQKFTLLHPFRVRWAECDQQPLVPTPLTPALAGIHAASAALDFWIPGQARDDGVRYFK